MPPGIKEAWDDNHVDSQASLIGYEQLRDYEDQEERNTLYKMLGARR